MRWSISFTTFHTQSGVVFITADIFHKRSDANQQLHHMIDMYSIYWCVVPVLNWLHFLFAHNLYGLISFYHSIQLKLVSLIWNQSELNSNVEIFSAEMKLLISYARIVNHNAIVQFWSVNGLHIALLVQINFPASICNHFSRSNRMELSLFVAQIPFKWISDCRITITMNEARRALFMNELEST